MSLDKGSDGIPQGDLEQFALVNSPNGNSQK